MCSLPRSVEEARASRVVGSPRAAWFAPWSAAWIAAWIAASPAVGLSLTGCWSLGSFHCDEDAQCDLGGRSGRCIEPGYCALPDDRCGSGYRFDASVADAQLAGTCVESLGAGSTDGPSGAPSTADGGTDDAPPGCDEDSCGCALGHGAGDEHVCALRSDAVIVCWGRNEQAELGQGTSTAPVASPEPISVSAEASFRSVVVGNHHSCGLTSSGVAWCWGRNAWGELLPNRGADEHILEPRKMDFDGAVGAVGVSPQHTCLASAVDGRIRCIGDNSDSELGPDAGAEGPSRVEIPTDRPVEQLALGQSSSCAYGQGRVWCWGSNAFGQLGVGAPMESSEQPVEIELDGVPEALSAGRDHVCASVDGGDRVLCWGDDSQGQLGDGPAGGVASPTAVEVTGLAERVVQLSARRLTTCALLVDGSLWCWGGTLGPLLGADVDVGVISAAPARITVVDEIMPPLVEFSLGEEHLCASSSSGRLWCWGSNHAGQLGPSAPEPGQRTVELDLACPP